MGLRRRITWTLTLLGTAVLAASWIGDAFAQRMPPHVQGQRTYTDAAQWSLDFEELATHCGVTDAAALKPDDPVQADCILDDMRQSGASAQAQRFFQDTHYFLSDFRPLSPVVDFGHAYAPWIDMSRPQPVFLNDSPVVIWPDYDYTAFTDLQNDPLYSGFFARHPVAFPWPTYASLCLSAYGPSGGQLVTLSEPIRECRACDDLGNLLVTFTFDPSGAVTSTDVGPLQTNAGY